jgi:hypothetical protein
VTAQGDIKDVIFEHIHSHVAICQVRSRTLVTVVGDIVDGPVPHGPAEVAEARGWTSLDEPKRAREAQRRANPVLDSKIDPSADILGLPLAPSPRPPIHSKDPV